MSAKRKFYQAVALAILLLVLLVTYLLLLLSVAKLPVVWDFAIYYGSARHFWEGQSLYAAVPVDAFGTPPDSIALVRDTLHANLSPPPAMLLMAPLGLWSYESAYSIWTIVSILCGLAAVVWVGSTFDRGNGRVVPTLVLGILLLVYFPTFVNVQLGQVALLLLLLLSIVWVAARAGHDAVAGIALGFALTMKLFAALLLLYFLVRRRWRLAAWSAATLLVTTAAGLLVFGPASFREYLRALETVTWYASNWNASFLDPRTYPSSTCRGWPMASPTGSPWWGLSPWFGCRGLVSASRFPLSSTWALASLWRSCFSPPHWAGSTTSH
jgi:alpha-1,2-mannosyltransferase